MTGQEMVYNFQQLLQTISSNFETKDRLNTYEILDFLNRASDRYVKEKYFSGNSFKENVEKLKTSLDDLANLITMTTTGDTPIFTAVPGMGGAFSTPLPANFFGYIRSDSEITRTTILPIARGWIPNVEIDFGDVGPLLTTALNAPILQRPLAIYMDNADEVDDSKELIVVVDGNTTITDILVTYIRKLTPIDMTTNDCELASYTHEEIVRLAVSIYFDENKAKLVSKA